MKPRGNASQTLIFAAFGLIPVVWTALLAASVPSGNTIEIIQGLVNALNSPLDITICANTPKTVLVFIGGYSIGIVIYFSTRRNTRFREEHGSAKWGSPAALCRKYADKSFAMNKILTQNVRIGFNTHKHRHNLNVLVIGGSGASKTRGYGKPNVMNANCSMVILDPKGEIARDTGLLLKAKGYEVKVLDLINMEKSHCFNPFQYLDSDNDVQRLVTNFFKSTTPKNSSTNDPFWDTAAQMLLMALVFFLKYEAPPEEQNFAMVMDLLRAGEIKEEDEDFQSVLDELFERLERRDPRHVSLKYYRAYRSGSGKTLKSILITLSARLEKFNLMSLAGLTATDELELQTLGERKTALFLVIPDNDTSFNFLISILYTQLFQQLFYSADYHHNGTLPVHVHFIMDEFANVSLPDDFDKILSVMRSRGVSVSIILQNLSQLKFLFEKNWESLVGNCDEFLYLGGNEQSTHKFVSELLGKETLDTNTFGKSLGKNGSYSTNYQTAGRELLTPDEVRKLDNDYALLFIRGELPIIDKKFAIKCHPNVNETPDGKHGKAKIFKHGEVTELACMLEINSKNMENITNPAYDIDNEFILLSDEDLEENYGITETPINNNKIQGGTKNGKRQ